MNKKWIRKMQTAAGGHLKKVTINKSVPEITVVPNKLYLRTHYPVLSKDFPLTGHSEIDAYIHKNPEYDEKTDRTYFSGVDHTYIDKLMSDDGYNLVTNNCADATRCTLENISGRKMNPYFFTTPGDVLDFFKKNFDVKKDLRRSKVGTDTYYTNISEADFEKIDKLHKELLEANERMRLRLFDLRRNKQLAQNKKDGGILEFLKNGSGIHIKKKNRGKFTEYCGGTVTDECIRKAKASGNPTLVKRATFALNSRRWKHKKGGKAFVNGVSVLDSNPNAYKLVKKKVKMRLYGGYLDTSMINYSPIVGRHLSWLQEASDYATKLENLKRELKLIELLLKLEQQNKITDNLFGLTNTILNSIGSKKPKTTTNNGNPASTSGTSSLLTNIGNTGSLSSNLNPMNFFGL